MFNGKVKKEALKSHEQAIKDYEKEIQEFQKSTSQLNEKRESALEILRSTENIINSIKNTPDSYSVELGKIYHAITEYSQEEYDKRSFKNIIQEVSGFGLGLSLILTGIGISVTRDSSDTLEDDTIEDFERTNDSENNKTKTYTGVVLVISGCGVLIKSTFTYNKNNKKIAQEAQDETKTILADTKSLRYLNARIKEISMKIMSICNGFRQFSDQLINLEGKNYEELDKEDILFLGAIINNMLGLCELNQVRLSSHDPLPEFENIEQLISVPDTDGIDILSAIEVRDDTQTQAIASWSAFLKWQRAKDLLEHYKQLDLRKEGVFAELDELKQFISDPSHILGNVLSKHGEIAEHCQVNISNAQNIIEGLSPKYTFEGVGRLAPDDYLYAGMPIQSKFYNGARATLKAISKHLDTYPDFVKNGGSYDVPKDQFEEMINVIRLSKEAPSAIRRQELHLLNAIKLFESQSGLKIEENLNPAVVTFKDVQLYNVSDTIQREEDCINKKDKNNREVAKEKTAPSLKEGAKVVGVSAAIEGGFDFLSSMREKRKQGIKITEFTEKDWKDVGIKTGQGVVKGAIRGGNIYLLTNYTTTPANLAAAYVSAVFGIISQIEIYRNNELTDEELIINCEEVCFDVSISAIAALAGQALIPIPVLGSTIGSIVGKFVFNIIKDNCNQKEYKMISKYYEELCSIRQNNESINSEIVMLIEEKINQFHSMQELAFDQNTNIAFAGSIDLAISLGVENSKIKKSEEEVRNYIKS
ncbi:hypothetical protein [Anaerobium acetethylicum]|uniref:Uncharacterized protein n=1 Tax=Anaerobium acetethylicum TaxID=1619234 RepID=A0A1D3TZ37_9FIRM|nr:hypothetical protein [Anaerobium acetethylicum]SCP99775.1 hypothetical protein SAMN05421730_10588 [Anaerobium acetethylicum]